jgi:hypothetical protein
LSSSPTGFFRGSTFAFFAGATYPNALLKAGVGMIGAGVGRCCCALGSGAAPNNPSAVLASR